MGLLEGNIPFEGIGHFWGILVAAAKEADADDVVLPVFEEETDALETAGVACPAPGAGDATWKEFGAVAVGHAAGRLEFGVEGGCVFGDEAVDLAMVAGDDTHGGWRKMRRRVTGWERERTGGATVCGDRRGIGDGGHDGDCGEE